jgi:hypothetical protein
MADQRTGADGTGEGLMGFLDYAGEKGLLKKNTAGALRAAVDRVLSVEGDGWEGTDVVNLDMEDLLRRFANLRKQDFTPGSLESLSYSEARRTVSTTGTCWPITDNRSHGQVRLT